MSCSSRVRSWISACARFASSATTSGDGIGWTTWRLRPTSICRFVDGGGEPSRAQAATGKRRPATSRASRVFHMRSSTVSLHPGSRRADLIAELVRVVRAPREVLRQDAADLGHTRDHGLAHPARPQALDHQVPDARPVVIADPGVDALVAHDGELAVLQREIDQPAVAPGRAMHAELREQPSGARERIHAATPPPVLHVALEVDADLRRGLSLGRDDGGGDGLEVLVGEPGTRPGRVTGHHQPPLAPPPPNPPPPPEKPPPPAPPKPPPPPPQKMKGGPAAGRDHRPPRPAV